MSDSSAAASIYDRQGDDSSIFTHVSTHSTPAAQFLQQRVLIGESQEETFNQLVAKPREGFFGMMVSKSRFQQHELRGRSKAKKETNDATIQHHGNLLVQQQQEVSELEKKRDAINEQFMDLHKQLLECTSNLHAKKLSLEKSLRLINGALTDNRVLDFMIMVCDKILNCPLERKPFASMLLKAIRGTMKLKSWDDIKVLKPSDVHHCIRILDNFGIEGSPEFRALWRNPDGEAAKQWRREHGRTPHVATGKVADPFVMQKRLAAYLNIPVPDGAVYEAANHVPAEVILNSSLESIPEEALEAQIAAMQKEVTERKRRRSEGADADGSGAAV